MRKKFLSKRKGRGGGIGKTWEKEGGENEDYVKQRKSIGKKERISHLNGKEKGNMGESWENRDGKKDI